MFNPPIGHAQEMGGANFVIEDKPSKHTFFCLYLQTSIEESEERRIFCIIESQVPQTPIVLHSSHLRVMVESSAIRRPDA